ncbi:hydrogenase 3 maturation endopeptidase HyCI [Planctomycetota bacterium]
MGQNQQFPDILNKVQNTKTLIVGIGNTLKGDDGLGPIICEKLIEQKISADVIDTGNVPENYIQTIIKKDPENLLVIDAADFGSEPGTIKVFKTGQLNSIGISTHCLSPKFFIDMILQSIAPEIYFIGVQPAHTQLGRPVSEKVNNSINELCDYLTQTFPPKTN